MRGARQQQAGAAPLAARWLVFRIESDSNSLNTNNALATDVNYRPALTARHHQQDEREWDEIPRHGKSCCRNSPAGSEPRSEWTASPSRGLDWQGRSWPCALVPPPCRDVSRAPSKARRERQSMYPRPSGFSVQRSPYGLPPTWTARRGPDPASNCRLASLTLQVGRVGGQTWYWPPHCTSSTATGRRTVTLLTGAEKD